MNFDFSNVKIIIYQICHYLIFKINSMPLIMTLAFFLVVSAHSQSRSISKIAFDSIALTKLKGFNINNGLALHPTKNLILISRPSSHFDSAKQRPFYRIYQITYQKGEWKVIGEVSFSSAFNDYHPVFSPDGQWIYFNSDRPKLGVSDRSMKINIWRIRIDSINQQEPEFLYAINTEHHESYPSISSTGTLYFNSDRPGGKGSMDIYKSEWKIDHFSNPVPVIELNTEESENDLVVDPLEGFIIFNRYHFNTNEIDLYVSTFQDGEWLEAKPVSSLNNEGVWELTPTLAPDGKYFFYEVNGMIKVAKIECLMKK